VAIVGIDLGTTNSLVAVLKDGAPVTLPNELDEHLTPSAVAIAEDGTLLVGRAAKDRLVTSPESGRAFFKRDMGTDTKYRFGGRTWSPIECSAAILGEMKRIAELRLGSPVERAVVTVPAYFHDPQRQATVSAAEIAGLKVDRILNEPTAAALAYGYARPERECKILVFDLGGGTFDVTLLEVFEGLIEVRASSGDSRLGGEDYTDALLALVEGALGTRIEAPGSLRQKVEVMKRELSRAPSAILEHAGRTVTATRGEFEKAARALTERLRPIVRRCLRDASVRPEDLDDVLLVGGASRMPLVRAFVAVELGERDPHLVDYDKVVAHGAAVQAARCERQEAVRDVILTDVCPHSLGVEVCKEIAPDRHEPGYYLPILDRNVTVPASRVRHLHTIHPEQDRLELAIYQGESRRVEENTLLGKLHVPGLRHRPDQRHPGEVEVRFSYDANGLLEVEVTVLHSGQILSKMIESRPGALSRREIDEALRRLKPLKVRSRDLLPNRARIERAERAFRELTGADRDLLTVLLDRFERALEENDFDGIGYHGAALDQFVASRYAAEGETQAGPDPAP
jgi:molecular chaperone HscC